MATATATAGLSAASAKKLRGQLTTLAQDRVFPVVVETALFLLIIISTYIIWCARHLRLSQRARDVQAELT
ncbi:hypothetical protein GSI_04309 [Ganoderma sinense ZZ0214-1]|uniref:Uncharacterized protein n=1 Tax=Ganoderma sinense ZZ0214-1 TaxID=1077348 RepID=A0A2G8SIS8_9APHY|nr:hypothetical protein GSI_04309 [Ganoderma sinense ZZ0214-1]